MRRPAPIFSARADDFPESGRIGPGPASVGAGRGSVWKKERKGKEWFISGLETGLYWTGLSRRTRIKVHHMHFEKGRR
ncbi:hypothetical protein TRIP_B330342 [uncultured Desulfatiglans sp.]|uniref:Uncharacterized protein n=1 Tax=Uncultured Desulfatiglans sp. TaxID=1748965 RepID=A0A653A841_UNCDX|nr:hypothetical protein TRIP_B330342 [uncultured Desulfatiglans sp.]